MSLISPNELNLSADSTLNISARKAFKHFPLSAPQPRMNRGSGKESGDEDGLFWYFLSEVPPSVGHAEAAPF